MPGVWIRYEGADEWRILVAKLIIEYWWLASLRQVYVWCVPCRWYAKMSERADGCRLLTLQAIAPYVCVGTGIFHGRNNGGFEDATSVCNVKKKSTRNEYFF